MLKLVIITQRHSGNQTPGRTIDGSGRLWMRQSSVEEYFHKSILQMIIKDRRPLAIVEGQCFRAYDWANNTLQQHAKDSRTYVYTKEQLENSKAHDQLCNAAQHQLVLEVKMHGFLHMYCAKKILEWTASPDKALSIAIYLNDYYSLDGCDPNGHVGSMWSICAIHHQSWAERPIFGKICHKNYSGCKWKFDVAQFERKYAAKNA
ncbi:deoxyribodipyrimidine photo-lyase-like [Xyrauchen texanus]|uniref:deoxyribodipyrimidine photo-lyase-like n=1 Tax=Xyrauchen texanus TaxID=154827 RepID=UPI002242B10E|nr:deoxyribodipyrimidine photo-lyase-like [Xyrauchen texanus]